MRSREASGIALIFLIIFVGLTRCGDHGIHDPEAFFVAHRQELENVVESLVESRIHVIDGDDYATTSKYGERESDRPLYAQLQAFILQHQILNISVSRTPLQNPTHVRNTEFYVKRTNAFARITHYNFVHVPVVDNFKPYNPAAVCRMIAPPHWLYCEEPD